MSWKPPRILLLAWLTLLALLAMTVFFAYRPWGAFNLPIALSIATSKALLVATVFMEVLKPRDLRPAFACAGFFWFAIFVALTFIDYATRPIH